MNKITYIMDIILVELKSYLNTYEYRHLKAIKNNIMIYYINDLTKTINLYDRQYTYMYTFDIDPYNQIIDSVPVIDHQIHYIQPVLLSYFRN